MTDTQDEIQGPAILTAMHAQDRLLSPVAGAAKGFRRHDGLSYLHTHGAIGDHQLAAGRKLQADWQASKIEASPRMAAGGGGSSHGVLSDTALDAGQRTRAAMAVVPSDCGTILIKFLLPEDHPLSMEEIGLQVRRSPRGVSWRIKKGLSALAKHYGFGG